MKGNLPGFRRAIAGNPHGLAVLPGETAFTNRRAGRRRQTGFVATNSAQPMLPAFAEFTQKHSASTVESMVS